MECRQDFRKEWSPQPPNPSTKNVEICRILSIQATSGRTGAIPMDDFLCNSSTFLPKCSPTFSETSEHFSQFRTDLHNIPVNSRRDPMRCLQESRKEGSPQPPNPYAKTWKSDGFWASGRRQDARGRFQGMVSSGTSQHSYRNVLKLSLGLRSISYNFVPNFTTILISSRRDPMKCLQEARKEGSPQPPNPSTKTWKYVEF